jgi:hypothetical protein
MEYSPVPIQGLPVMPPTPLPGERDIFRGYRRVSWQANGKRWMRPQLSFLSTRGWVQVLVLSVFCFPLAWIPCCLTSNYNDYQVPVFESV